MRFNHIVFITSVLFLFSNCSNEIINMDAAKNQVRNYYESGEYSEELIKIVDDTIEKLSGINLYENSAVVFDVDDTVLSGYEYTKNLGFGFTYPTWKDWMLNEKLKAIPEMKKFYDWLIGKNISIVFLTGRPNDVCEATYNNLIKEGFTQFDTLICRSNRFFGVPASEYKPVERKALTESGYKIIASLGDQWSDLAGEYAGIKVKLPNYLYQVD